MWDYIFLSDLWYRGLKDQQRNNNNIYSFFSGSSNIPGKYNLETYLGGSDYIDHGDKKECILLNFWAAGLDVDNERDEEF
ncbi:hypothetical protein VP01_120g7 [Puccinia sorghi]|uniref:Uncharacterized protein n=1 Tax=Puccinia sorghi TaxID=27349 RepID=A0A0L6VQC6_9BASI|nr:hypothetical protein VP01_120g7 [Puccinia sorghi]